MYYYPVTVYPTSTPQQLATTPQQQQPYHILQQQQVNLHLNQGSATVRKTQ